MKLRLTLSLLIMVQSAWAALPPAAESLRRIKAITESKELYDNLESADWVNAITQEGDGYVVKTQKCILHVDVKSLDKQPSHPRLIGPLPLVIDIKKKECHS